jgi:hypothetical protein
MRPTPAIEKVKRGTRAAAAAVRTIQGIDWRAIEFPRWEEEREVEGICAIRDKIAVLLAAPSRNRLCPTTGMS